MKAIVIGVLAALGYLTIALIILGVHLVLAADLAVPSLPVIGQTAIAAPTPKRIVIVAKPRKKDKECTTFPVASC